MDHSTTSAGSDIPCPVFTALARSCHSCHGEVPANGAPMALVKTADFEALSVGKPKIPKYDLALMRMDGSRRPPMPPATSAITDEDKTTIMDWLKAKAPAASGDAAACK